jgi:hypothetical protein
MKNTISFLLAMLAGTACMAPMDDEPIVEDTMEVDESGQSLTRASRSWDGEACTVTGDGESHDGKMQGGLCCFENGNGGTDCWNCSYVDYDCTSPREFGGGWGAPIRDQLGF